MTKRSLTAMMWTAFAATAVAATPSAAVRLRAPSCECLSGYYHRRADADDMACVTAASRALIQQEHAPGECRGGKGKEHKRGQ